jgi:hypothetical protein
MHLLIIILGGLAGGVYWDAAKHKIGKVSGEVESNNRSAGAWAALSLLLVPAWTYYSNRKVLLARAAEHPVAPPHPVRTKAIIFGTMGFLVFLANLGVGGNIGMVQGGILEFNKSLTVGEAFDNYKYFRNTRWEQGTTDNGMDFVNAIGEVDLDSHPIGKQWKAQGCRKAEALFQFAVNKDGETFELRACTMRLTNTKGESTEVDAAAEDNDITVADVMGALGDIYENEPFS